MSLVNDYDGFIFDFGKVLVTDQMPFERAQMAKIVGASIGDFDELYWKDRADYDKGLMNGIEYWGAIGKNAGKLMSLDDISRAVDLDSASWMHFDEPMWVLVDELRSKGKKVAVLSNMPADLGETIKSKTNRFTVFDHVTLSYEVKSVKPEAAIYEDCLAGIGTERKKTIFFDDKRANVKGAEMVGLDAIEFLDRDAVLKQLRG